MSACKSAEDAYLTELITVSNLKIIPTVKSSIVSQLSATLLLQHELYIRAVMKTFRLLERPSKDLQSGQVESTNSPKQQLNRIISRKAAQAWAKMAGPRKTTEMLLFSVIAERSPRLLEHLSADDQRHALHMALAFIRHTIMPLSIEPAWLRRKLVMENDVHIQDVLDAEVRTQLGSAKKQLLIYIRGFHGWVEYYREAEPSNNISRVDRCRFHSSGATFDFLDAIDYANREIIVQLSQHPLANSRYDGKVSMAPILGLEVALGFVDLYFGHREKDGLSLTTNFVAGDSLLHKAQRSRLNNSSQFDTTSNVPKPEVKAWQRKFLDDCAPKSLPQFDKRPLQAESYVDEIFDRCHGFLEDVYALASGKRGANGIREIDALSDAERRTRLKSLLEHPVVDRYAKVLENVSYHTNTSR